MGRKRREFVTVEIKPARGGRAMRADGVLDRGPDRRQVVIKHTPIIIRGGVSYAFDAVDAAGRSLLSGSFASDRGLVVTGLNGPRA